MSGWDVLIVVLAGAGIALGARAFARRILRRAKYRYRKVDDAEAVRGLAFLAIAALLLGAAFVVIVVS